MYFVLDSDKSILKLKIENLDVRFITNCFQMDIEYELMSNGGMLKNSISQVVIDPINFIIRKEKESIIDVIEKLRSIENNYKVENFDPEKADSIREKFEGGIAICDAGGVTLIESNLVNSETLSNTGAAR